MLIIFFVIMAAHGAMYASLERYNPHSFEGIVERDIFERTYETFLIAVDVGVTLGTGLPAVTYWAKTFVRLHAIIQFLSVVFLVGAVVNSFD